MVSYSMGQVGAAGDNPAMESFFSLLQKNALDRKRWRTREELRIAIITWIERTYHRHLIVRQSLPLLTGVGGEDKVSQENLLRRRSPGA